MKGTLLGVAISELESQSRSGWEHIPHHLAPAPLLQGEETPGLLCYPLEEGEQVGRAG